MLNQKSILMLFLFLPFLTYGGNFNKIQMEDPEDLLSFLELPDGKLLTNLTEMDNRKLNASKLENPPWSGYHWPLEKGLISFRYADKNLPRSESWTFYRDYVTNNKAKDYIDRGEINLLSPSEKYDLLMSDGEFTLTNKMWDWGKIEMETIGKINHWASLSHGFSLASMNLPIPKNPVKIWSLLRKYKITFFPEDIKALGSLMWTLGAESIISLGERCKEGNPQTDESGRMLTPECFDLHPGKFHISLVNQIGIVKKAFVMDSFGNEPVWNFPVIGYSFIYFNPNKPDEGNNLQNSIIDIKNYSNDRFLNHRNPNAKYIVGVKAYVNSVPNITPWTTTSFEREKIFSYTYDLELDQNFNIIGGEWYSTNRPDFIWKTTKNFEPKTPIEDDMNAKWDPEKEYIPRDWLPHAKASSKHGVVLSPIVNQLFRLSSEGLNGYLTN